MKHFVVINPHSFRTPKELQLIIEEIDACFLSPAVEEHKIHISRYQRDAVATVNRYMLSVPPDETVRVYAVGGDGILFDCLNGMVRFKNAELTSVPYGKANDYIRAFGEDAAPAFRDIRRLMTAPARPVDIISYGANYALNEANIGIIGLSTIYSNIILRNPNYKWTRLFTSQIYTFGGFRSLLSHDVVHQEYSVQIDGEDVSGSYSNLYIANGPCNGDYLVSDPYAIPDDGFFDVILARSTSALKLASVIGDYTSGKFEKHKDIFSLRRCKTLKVHSEHSLCVELDGESFYARDIQLELIPGGIRFFAPEGMGFADYSHRAAKGATNRKGGEKA